MIKYNIIHIELLHAKNNSPWPKIRGKTAVIFLKSFGRFFLIAGGITKKQQGSPAVLTDDGQIRRNTDDKRDL
jgi:hypothetical protein